MVLGAQVLQQQLKLLLRFRGQHPELAAKAPAQAVQARASFAGLGLGTRGVLRVGAIGFDLCWCGHISGTRIHPQEQAIRRKSFPIKEISAVNGVGGTIYSYIYSGCGVPRMPRGGRACSRTCSVRQSTTAWRSRSFSAITG